MATCIDYVLTHYIVLYYVILHYTITHGTSELIHQLKRHHIPTTVVSMHNLWTLQSLAMIPPYDMVL